MPFARAGGSTVHYEISGPAAAPALVFVNSLGTTLHLWDAQLSAFAQRYRIVRYDMRGHGLSAAGPEREYTIAGLADDLAELLDALAIARATIVGLSIGGVVAQRFAAAYPARVTCAALCATGSRIGSPAMWNERIAAVERSGLPALADATLGRWFTPATQRAQPVVVDGFRQMLERTPVAGYVGCCAALRDADQAADDARIVAPTLVVAGSADVVTPPELGAGLREVIPNARLAVIDGAAHLLNADQPERFNAVLDAFLAAAVASASSA